MDQVKNQSEAGFTILETAISMVLMAVVGLGIALLFAYSASNTANAADRQMATAVAQQRMEQLKNVAFTDTTLNVTSTSGVTTTVTRLGRDYSVNTNITANASATLKTITVKVTPVASSAKTVNTIFGSVTLVSTRSTQLLGSNRSY
ncbi:MAG TPA: hypothetical protein VFI24_16320 [Pyrinomonadaceae bacterium]|nr:hypothetical protein [Pyrinomonadaceae bacterium]